ncbi:MAG: type I-E CRISPR-associated endoribonuclease Cas2e [Eubacteriaceae bacterium]|nr:type I-E CRISPR-associated endoribonuclease Cas2e [Eubacteriaceae bacterium]
MMVLHVTNCPPALRGDLTKWLMEIAAGVYVGNVSARVRDQLWDRVVETIKGGRAVTVFSANNEQHMDFRIHGETWEPIDFDGLKLMLRPSPSRLAAKQAKRSSNKKLGFSSASRYNKAKTYSKTRRNSGEAEAQRMYESNETKYHHIFDAYVVVDIETTGLNPSYAEITEVGAIKVKNGQVVDTFQSLTRTKTPIPPTIMKITGITNDMLDEQGKPLNVVMENLMDFLDGLPIVAHNAPFDVSFLNEALIRCGFGRLTNHIEDTLMLSKKTPFDFASYKLKALAEDLGLDLARLDLDGLQVHRSLGDCYLTHHIFQKLINIEEQELE